MRSLSLGSSHTHSSQHFPGSFTLRGYGQSGLGRRTSMLQRGTQPTAPSRQVHWYLQLLWKDWPLRYTMPPNIHGAPSFAANRKQDSLINTQCRLSSNGAIRNLELYKRRLHRTDFQFCLYSAPLPFITGKC